MTNARSSEGKDPLLGDYAREEGAAFLQDSLNVDMDIPHCPYEADKPVMKGSSFDNTFHSANSDLHPLGFHKPLYSTIRVITFSFFALILGTITAVVFGLVFGILEAINMYILRPVTVMILLSYAGVMDIYTVMIRSILDPLYDSFSRSFSNISMRYRKLRDEEAIAHREPQTIAV